MSGYKADLFEKYDNKIQNSIKIKLLKEKTTWNSWITLFVKK